MRGYALATGNLGQGLLVLALLAVPIVDLSASEPYDRDASIDSLQQLFENGDFDGVMKTANKAIENTPGNQDDPLEKDQTIRAYLYRAMAWREKGNTDECLADCETCGKLCPTDKILETSVAYLCSAAHCDKGNYAAAIPYYEYLVRENPEEADYYGQMAFACGKLGEHNKSFNAYRAAIELRPKDAEFLNNFAWLLATCPSASVRDGKAAVENATAACELVEYKNWAYMDTLAAAYAEAGDFENASVWASGAMELAVETKVPPNEIEDLKKRSSLFDKQQPYHESPAPSVAQAKVNQPPASSLPAQGASKIPPASPLGIPDSSPTIRIDAEPEFKVLSAERAGMFALNEKSIVTLDKDNFVGLRDVTTKKMLWGIKVTPLPNSTVLARFLDDDSLLLVTKTDTRRIDSRTGNDVWRTVSRVDATSLRTMSMNDVEVVVLKDALGNESVIELKTGRPRK